MQKKLFINFVIILLIGVLISGFLSVGVIEKYYNQAVEERLLSNAYLIRDLIGDSLLNNNKIYLDNYLQRIKVIVNSRITVIDMNGTVLSDTETDSKQMDNHSDRPEVREAYKGKVGKSRRYSDTVGVDLLYIAQPIYVKGTIQGVLRLSTPLRDIDNLMRRLYFSAFISIISGLFIASILGYKMTTNITKPIKEMTYVASQITKGHFEKRISLKSSDEMGQLASSINYMAQTLNETINSINDKNIKQEAILSSVVNGIIAIDSAKRILFINPVAINMLDIKDEDIIGKHFLQIVRNNQLDNFLKNAIQDKNFIDTEIHINFPEEKILKIYTNPIKHVDNNAVIGIIITIQDVSELRKLEKMRSEFVANVSHELKTPLTSIKGFVETLKAGAIDDKEAAIRFLSIIEDESDRLNRLISDILSLSELENKKGKAAIDNLDVRNEIKEVVSMLHNQAAKKNIKITTDISEDLYNIVGEKDNLKQMLINLIDNAVKYTPDNGLVNVHAYNSDNSIVLNISDNGIGIPKEHIPRLFERFYRVDRARSRNIGGTGLGLAIVKHIVKLFEGEIEVDSIVGRGTSFKITIPVNNTRIN